MSEPRTGDQAPPPWLEQIVAALCDGPDAAALTDPAVTAEVAETSAAAADLAGAAAAAAAGWTDAVARLRAELDRLTGPPPLRVAHDWHANTVAPMLAEPGGDAARAHLEAARLHRRALAGEPIAPGDWAATLEPALRDVYRRAYPYADCYAVAHANATAYATANDYSDAEIVEFARAYAILNTDASVQSFVDANAAANGAALASAFAAADSDAYTSTYPFATARAYGQAHANQGKASGPRETASTGETGVNDETASDREPANGGKPATCGGRAGDHATAGSTRRATAYARLADGLADALRRTRS